MSPFTGPVYAPEDYAGFIRRTAALVIDILIVFAVWFAAGEILPSAALSNWFTEDGYFIPSIEAGYHLSLWVLAVLYMLGLRLTSGGTIGYRIARIRYAYALGDKPPVFMILYRAFIAVFLLWFFALDHIWIAFDERKQAWHDKVSGFYVIKCGARPIATRPVVRRYIQFMLLTFPVWEPETQAGDTP